jgi:hypothetical protein
VVALVDDDQTDLAALFLRVEQSVQPLLTGEGLHRADHDVGRDVVGRRLHLAHEQAGLGLLQLVHRLVGQLVAVHENDDARTLSRDVLGGHAAEDDRLAHAGREHDGRPLHPVGPRRLHSVDGLALVRAERDGLAHTWSLPLASKAASTPRLKDSTSDGAYGPVSGMGTPR